MAGGPSGGNRGAASDRGPRERGRGSRFERHVLIAICIVLSGAALALALSALHLSAGRGVVRTAEFLRVLAAAIFLGAGILRLSRWRIAADARSALMGSALVVLGALGVPLAATAAVVTAGQPDSALRVLARLVTTAVVLCLVGYALARRESTTARSPAALLTNAALAAIGSFGVLVVVARIWPAALYGPRWVQVAIAGLMSVGWLGVAGYAATRRGVVPWAGRVAPLLGLLGVVDLCGIVAIGQRPEWDLTGALLTAAAATWAARNAMLDLSDASADSIADVEEYLQELGDARRKVSMHDAWREELAHDARNALAGLRAAIHTLDRYDGQLDPSMTERLRSAAIGEIGHLEHLIIRAEQDEPVDFDVLGAIQDAVETRRAAGLGVEVHGFSCLAHGRPGDLVTVVQNLLVNAHQHAGGKEVRICVVQTGRRVQLFVSDHGPGLSTEQAARLFTRGARGEDSAGSGLGLFVSRTLMREQGGDLELRAHTGGAVFVVSLLAAQARPRPIEARLPRQRGATVRPAEVRA